MNSNTAPSPAIMPKFRTPTVPAAAVVHESQAQASQTPEGVIKAKQLAEDMHVQAWLTINGTPKACGSVRTVGTVSPVKPDGTVDVTFKSLHPSETYKAARRFVIVEA